MKSMGFVLLIIMSICAVIGGFLWPYSIETVAMFFGKTVEVAFWQGAVLGFCPGVGQATIPIAAIVWILALVI